MNTNLTKFFQNSSFALVVTLLTACGDNEGGSSSSSTSSSSSASSSNSSSSSSSSSSGDPIVVTNHDHCETDFHPQVLTDLTMGESYAEYTEAGQTDTTVQPEVIDWMEQNQWQEAHFVWHEARRCGGGGFGGGGAKSVDPCNFPEMKPEQNECAGPQDGYEFLVMHRHMIQSLKQLWPNHTEQFDGWSRFPGREDYPELLRTYYTDWTNPVLQNAALADNIDKMTKAEALAQWPTEGDFGQWIQCGGFGSVGSGLHGALHFNGYPRKNQAHSVANQKRNLDAYQFWKLHGWIDTVWEKYRTVIGLTPSEPKLQNELIAQCKEMHFWADQIDPSLVIKEAPANTEGDSGFFHEKVRPALEEAGCATCHGAGEEAHLRLGYNISSKDIVKRLVNVDAWNVEGYKLVVPGDPDKSWLYLKSNGEAKNTNATCKDSAINTCKQNMPPSGGMGGMNTQQLQRLREWILDLE